MDICAITDWEGNLQGLVQVPNTTGYPSGVITKTADVEKFKKDLVEYVNEFYMDDVDVLDVEISPRFWKFEPTEAKFLYSDGAEEQGDFYLTLQLTGVSTTQKVAYLLEYNEPEPLPIAVVLASDRQELLEKAHVALAEEFDPDMGSNRGIEADGYEVIDWGVSSALIYRYFKDGEEEIRDIRITKLVSY